jgi:ABC-type Fe3+ transport system substrate-binding protein
MPTGQYLQGYLYPQEAYVMGIAYNNKTLTADQVPKGAEDLVNKVKANPDYWKGKIYLYDPRFTGTGWIVYYNLRKTVGKDKALAWYKTLLDDKSVLTMSGATAAVKVSPGEAYAQWDATSANWGSNVFGSAPMANLAFKAWEDVPLMSLRIDWVALKNGGGHPNATKLWMDYVLSLAGQSKIATYAISTRTDYLEKGPRTPMMDWWGKNVVQPGLDKKFVFDSIFPEERALEFANVKQAWITEWESAMGFK